MSFSFDNNVPIYIQLVEQIKLDIISGVYKPGERLLSVRDMAFEKKVNPNTMQKALTELESMKLIFTERTNGKFVSLDEKLIEKYKKEYADSLTKNYFMSMKSVGFDGAEITKYLEEIGGEK